MKQRLFRLLAAAAVMGAMILMSGCASLFPTEKSVTQSKWTNYATVQLAFDRIQTNRTTEAELKAMGFDPKVSPNIKVLTYVDIIMRFMPNQAIRMEDLHPAVRQCIQAKEHCRAYEIQLKNSQSKRHGNLFLDIFGFKRQTHQTGWEFDGLILLDDDKVAYKLASGQPDIVKDDKRVRPLGPLQELEVPVAAAMKIH